VFATLLVFSQCIFSIIIIIAVIIGSTCLIVTYRDGRREEFGDSSY